MRNTIFFRIFSGYFIVTALLALAILSLTFGLIREFYAGMLLNKLKAVAGVVELMLAESAAIGDYKSAGLHLEKAGAFSSVRIKVVLPDGRVIADSDKHISQTGKYTAKPETDEEIPGSRKHTLKKYRGTAGEEMFYYDLTTGDAGGGTDWTIRASIPASDMNRFLDGLKNRIMQATAAALILVFAVSYFLSRRILVPIKKIGEASSALASGNLGIRVDYEGKDELYGLAEAFNKMAKELEGMVAALSGQKERLNTVISSVKEGLLVIDNRGKITIANKSASQILGFKNPELKNYWECMAGKDFNDVMESAMRARSNHVSKIEINSRYYLCSVTYLEGTGEIIAILYDVTEMEEFEKTKKDFVANVSHELRTPLTAIKGFAETLESESQSGEEKKYLNIIIRHSERLMNIVSDLLVISKLESVDGKSDFSEVDLKSLCEGVVKIMEPAAIKKKIDIFLAVEEALPKLSGDAFKLEQMMINLIDNAVKYTDHGSVAVSISCAEGYAVINVSDTGSGIPKEHLSRIFERFYVVDTSRSRRLGGTGLGLSIVKHIVIMHGGIIEAASELGKGSKFTVKLPLKKA